MSEVVQKGDRIRVTIEGPQVDCEGLTTDFLATADVWDVYPEDVVKVEVVRP